MNTTTRTAAALGLSALAVFGVAGGAMAASVAPVVTATADSELVETLTYMREEERLARDLYATIAEMYDGARPFSMITNSEDNHFDAVGVLLDRYGIDDPSDGLAAGTFAIDEIQDLYDELLADAEASLTAAYDVGITVEETDIDDLQVALAADFPTDVDTVLQNLLNGSENHLAAFTAAADGTYVAGTGTNGGGNGQAMGRMAARGAGQTQGTANGAGGGTRAANASRAAGDCPLME